MTEYDEPGPSIAHRCVVTFGLLLLLVVGKFILLPGLSIDDFPFPIEGPFGAFEVASFSIGAQGGMPFINGFFTVELAAVVVPAWRKLRNGSSSGRAKLRNASWILAFVFCAVNGFNLGKVLESAELTYGISTPLLILSYMGWTFVLFVGSLLVDRRGILGGLPTLVLGESVFSVVQGLTEVESRFEMADLLFFFALLVLASGLFSGSKWNHRVERSEEVASGGGAIFPWFVSGIIPLALGQKALGLSDGIGHLLPEEAQRLLFLVSEQPWWTLGIVLAAHWIWAGAFYSRKDLARLRATIGLSAAVTGSSFRQTRMASSLAISLLWVSALAAWWFGLYVDIVSPFVIVALVLDGVGDVGFFRRHGKTETVYEGAPIFWNGEIRDALRAEGIPVHLSGFRYRSLLHFFAPHAPVRVVVPADDVSDACELLRSLIDEGLAQDAVVTDVKGQEGGQLRPLYRFTGRAKLFVSLSTALIIPAYFLGHSRLPQIYPVRPGGFAIYSVNDGFLFKASDYDLCEDIEPRTVYVGPEMDTQVMPFSYHREAVVECMATLSLPAGLSFLLERTWGDDPETFDGWTAVLVVGAPAITSSDVASIELNENGDALTDEHGTRYVVVHFRDPKLFEKVTKQHIEKRLGYTVGEEVLSTPRVLDAISGGSAWLVVSTDDQLRAEQLAILVDK